MSSSSSSSESTAGPSEASSSTDTYTWYKVRDHEYRLETTRFGTYRSFHKDGTELVTGLTEDAVRVCTEDIHIPFYYESDTSDINTTEYSDTGSEPLT